MRAVKGSPVVLVGYAVLSFAYFGWRLLPHPGREILGVPPNPDIYIWSFAWWEHALAAPTNPFYSHALYAPTGVNIAWTPSAPGLALAFAPLTALVGPVASFNVAGVLLPALAAWTAFLLCRELTGSVWGSLVGGYLFGFSDAVLRQVQPGNVNLSAVFLFPLVALVLVRRLRGRLSGRGLAWRLGLLLAGQLMISTEFAATLTLMLALGLLLAYGLMPDLRSRLRASLVPILAGYGLAAVFAGPLVWYLLTDFQSSGIVLDIHQWGTDLLGFGVPNGFVELGSTGLSSLVAHVPSRSAYLGLPTLLILVLFLVRGRRRPGTRFLGAAFGVAVILTLGAELRVYGHTLFTLPWWTAATHVPVLDAVLPFRLGIYVALAAAVAVALWTATTKGRVFARPYVLPVLAVVALAPSVFSSASWYAPNDPGRPAFFSSDYKSCIPRGETIASFPTGNHIMLWQAETGFWFNVAGGALQPFRDPAKPPNAFDADPVVRDLWFAGAGKPVMARLLAFAGAHRVGRVLSAEGSGYPNLLQMRQFGTPQLVGGTIVSPGCGQPPLTTRNLSRYVDEYDNPSGRQAPTQNIAYCVGTTFQVLPSGLVPEGPAKRANFVAGQGLTCAPPPAGYKRRGFAGADLNVPAGIYPYYAP